MKKEKGEEREFGGAIGATCITLFSHVLVVWLYWCLHCRKGSVAFPVTVEQWAAVKDDLLVNEKTRMAPTWEAVQVYWGFLIFQGILAMVLPGIEVKGLPVPSEGNRQLVYKCNGVTAWWLTLIALAALHFSGAWELQNVIDLLGPLTIVSMISADIIAVITYSMSFANGVALGVSGNVFYDFFMGTYLNPRILNLDLKMWAEIRVSWMILFILALSAAAKQYQLYGVISTPMIFILTAQGLYANACMKGEECIPTTWDIFHEKWGWMLVYWNLCGVPFVYCTQAMYLAQHAPFEHNRWFQGALFVILFVAYYIWDTSQSQRNRFRMRARGTFVKRWAFPQLPWGTLQDDAAFLDTRAGSRLLIDGWWKYARKIHYTVDIVMAACWGLACGFNDFIPYFYPVFFLCMILHRGSRDSARCARKYGKDWDLYLKCVPYLYIPGVY